MGADAGAVGHECGREREMRRRKRKRGRAERNGRIVTFAILLVVEGVLLQLYSLQMLY